MAFFLRKRLAIALLIAIDWPQLTDFSLLLEFANSVLYAGLSGEKSGLDFWDQPFMYSCNHLSPLLSHSNKLTALSTIPIGAVRLVDF